MLTDEELDTIGDLVAHRIAKMMMDDYRMSNALQWFTKME